MDGSAFRKRHVRNRSFALASDVNPANEESLSRLQKFVRLCQFGVIGSLERFFTWYGELVATHPKKAISICISITLLGGLGLIRFYEEGDAASLVIPRNSKFRNDIDLLDNNFPREIRVHSIVYQAENVLTPSVIKAIYKQRRALQNIAFNGKSFKDMCIQVPILKIPDRNAKKPTTTTTKTPTTTASTGGSTEEEDEYDWDSDWFGDEQFKTEHNSSGIPPLLSALIPGLNSSTLDIDTLQRLSHDYYPFPYCMAAQYTEMACLENNIVELWAHNGVYDEESDKVVEGLNQFDILRTINSNNVSQIFLKQKNFTELLGDIEYNDIGEIIGAKAVEMKFFTSVNITAFRLYGTASRGEKIDSESYAFEGEVIRQMTNKSHFPAQLTSYVNIQRQFFESFVGQTFKDADKLGIGYVIVFVYVNFMLSKLNFVEQRVWLSVVGILSVAMGMVLGYGICSGFGLFYSAAHTVIPFLLLGIGIDNIFVITQAYDTLDTGSVPISLPKRFGQTMKHAGVAVSVTTFTDVFAFLVGSNTVLPGLESFCIYAAFSIFCIYVMQITHFVAWMSLDEQRMKDRKDGCCFCCITHKHFKQKNSDSTPMLNRVFLAIGKQLTKLHVKIIVLSMTILFLVGGTWGTFSLTQEYLPEWLLPPDSEVAQWFESKREFFPSAGEPGFIMIQQVDIPKEFSKIEELVTKMENLTGNIAYITPWHTDFREYVETFKTDNKTFEELLLEEGYFRNKLTQFLFSPKGAIYQANFWFADKLECGSPAPDILLQAIPYSHLRFERSTVWVPAMEAVEAIVESVPFSNYSFPIALTYINWKTDSIVGTELLRNVGIALVCIFLTTLATLGSWRGSLLVMMCVLFTCIDVTGFMHWWGLTIDITSMNVIIISVGLCVDFCAHIVHGFITGTGDRAARVLYVMENIAPAVMNGGLSTILALALLVTSRSHIFISFFKIFLLICLFGLFHGLITLPVVLTILGPTDAETKPKHKSVLKRESKLGLAVALSLRENEQNDCTGILEVLGNNNKSPRNEEVSQDHELVPLTSTPPTQNHESSETPTVNGATPTENPATSTENPHKTATPLEENDTKPTEKLASPIIDLTTKETPPVDNAPPTPEGSQTSATPSVSDSPPPASQHAHSKSPKKCHKRGKSGVFVIPAAEGARLSARANESTNVQEGATVQCNDIKSVHAGTDSEYLPKDAVIT